MPTAQDVFRIVDSRNAEGFAALFARAGRMTFGNADPMVGPAVIEAGIAGFFTAIAALRHRIVDAWTVGADTISEVEVTYTRLDGEEITLPGAAIWTVDADGRFLAYRVFVDQAPLFAP